MNVIMALIPILVVMIGMAILGISAKFISPIALVVSLGVAAIYFGTATAGLVSETFAGIISGAWIVYIICAAFLVLNMLKATGAMDKIKEMIGYLTVDKRKQIVVIAWGFGCILEGFAGAGTPAAICAPFLVGLGVSPLMACTAALICNGVPPSWGGIGVTTTAGFGAFSETFSMLSISAAQGRIHVVGAIIVPFILIFVLFGVKGFKGLIPFLLTIGLSSGAVLFIVSNFITPAYVDIATGITAIFVAVIYLKIDKSECPKEYRLDVKESEKHPMPAWKAMFTYALLLAALPVVLIHRNTWFGFFSVVNMPYVGYIGTTILIVSLIGTFVLGDQRNFLKHFSTSIKSVVPALISMCSLVALANIMKFSGMLNILATVLADMAGPIYPSIAVLIGSVGSFMTGTALGSNLMFSPMHYDAGTMLGLSPLALFGAQSAGAALGNMICPNNVVAVCTTVGYKEEGKVMRKIIGPILIMILVYGVVAMINTYLFY
jgi:lactate permease